MKSKIYFITIFLLISIYVFPQVGIGTNKPLSTLDVDGFPDSPDIVDGINPPVLTKMQLMKKNYSTDINATNAYTPANSGVIIYVEDVSFIGNDIPQTVNINEKGLYIFDGYLWKSARSSFLNLSIFRSKDSQRLIEPISSNDQLVIFNEKDSYVNNITKLTSDGGFEILESGYYQINSFLGIIPNVNTNGNQFSVARLIVKVKSGEEINDIADSNIIFQGANSNLINKIEINNFVSYLKFGDVVYLYIAFPNISSSKKYINPSNVNDGIIDIGKTENNIKNEQLMFSKSISIIKI